MHVHGYLVTKKCHPRTLWYSDAQGPVVVLGGGAFSHERGTPSQDVHPNSLSDPSERHQSWPVWVLVGHRDCVTHEACGVQNTARDWFWYDSCDFPRVVPRIWIRARHIFLLPCFIISRSKTARPQRHAQDLGSDQGLDLSFASAHPTYSGPIGPRQAGPGLQRYLAHKKHPPPRTLQ